MTEGIIQKVITKYRIRHIQDIDGLFYELQQELIQEIKKELSKATPKNSPEINAIWVNWVLTKLIGDTA
jgi:hypothetical protein